MSISLWLDKLGLGSYSSVFEEEELTEALLRSMAPDVLEAALDELGILVQHRSVLSFWWATRTASRSRPHSSQPSTVQRL